MLNSFGLLSFLGEYGKYIVNGGLQIGILFFFTIFMFKFLTKTSLKKTFYAFSYQKVSFRIVLISIGLGVVVYFLNIFIASFFNSILSLIGYEFSTSTSSTPTILTLILGLIFTAILPAICEENTHRGMLLFGNAKLGLVKNILLTGLMFGLLHMNIEQFFYATMIGIFLNFVLYATDSIYPSIIIHFMNNGIGVTLSYLTQTNVIRGGIFSKINEITSTNAMLGFIIIFVLMLVLVVLLIYLTKLLMRCSFEDSFKKKQKEVMDLTARFDFFSDIAKIKNGGKENELFNVKDLEIISFDVDKGEHHEVVLPKTKNEKMETRTKILHIASIVLMSAVTLFTLIWGII